MDSAERALQEWSLEVSVSLSLSLSLDSLAVVALLSRPVSM